MLALALMELSNLTPVNCCMFLGTPCSCLQACCMSWLLLPATAAGGSAVVLAAEVPAAAAAA
jgi:hypothetical protein